jgi:CBS domain containing-hemolysin-like protein
MTDFIIGFIFLILALAIVLVRKGYFYIPTFELKRRAASGDEYAKNIYPVAAYGSALRTLLWLLLGLFAAISLVEFDRVAPLYIGIILDAALLWLAFSWLPNSSNSSIGRQLTLLLNPLFAWVMHYLYPLLSKLDRLHAKYAEPHTRLFEQEDLSELIERQLKQTDNRISERTLLRAKKLIAFEAAKVSDYQVAWKQLMRVTATDDIGPKLLDELYRSGQSAFPVTQLKGGKDVVGVLNREAVGLKTQGQVKDFMQSNVTAVNEDESLESALDRFASTGQSLFLVINKDKKVTGAIMLKDCVSALMEVELSSSEEPLGEELEEEPVEMETGGENEAA